MLLQVERWRKAAEDTQRRLDVKENIMVELSRDGSKLDKERYLCHHAAGSCAAADRRQQAAAVLDAKASLLNGEQPPTAHLPVTTHLVLQHLPDLILAAPLCFLPTMEWASDKILLH